MASGIGGTEESGGSMYWIKEPFRRAFDYSGRSRRREYWCHLLVTFVALSVVGYVEEMLGLGSAGTPGSDGEGGILSSIVLITFATPGLAVAVRRLHDSNRAGWWLLLPAAPFLVWIVALFGQFGSDALFKPVTVAIFLCPVILLVLMCLPGTKGPNRFGADPKSEDLAEIFA
jgi:uncharacterized membrane protein YhaH (DUF805 family)